MRVSGIDSSVQRTCLHHVYRAKGPWLELSAVQHCQLFEHGKQQLVFHRFRAAKPHRQNGETGQWPRVSGKGGLPFAEIPWTGLNTAKCEGRKRKWCVPSPLRLHTLLSQDSKQEQARVGLSCQQNGVCNEQQHYCPSISRVFP